MSLCDARREISRRRFPFRRQGFSHAKTHLRDRVAATVCNWILNHVASRWYRDMIGGIIQSGLRAAVEAPRLREKLAKASKWNRYHQQKCANLRWQVSCDQRYIDALEKHVEAATITDIREQMKAARHKEAR